MSSIQALLRSPFFKHINSGNLYQNEIDNYQVSNSDNYQVIN